jgi:Virulence-associated protein E-like domain
MVLSASSNGENQAPENKLVSFTIFPDNHARKKQAKTLTLAQLALHMAGVVAARKDLLPLLKLASFGDAKSDKGCLRTNANMGACHGIEVEHDAGTVSFKRAQKILTRAGIAALLYTTPSHKPVDNERWRALLPFDKPHSKEERAGFVAIVNGLFDGALARESFAMSQAFYYGSVAGQAPSRIAVIAGVGIDAGHLTVDPIFPMSVAGKVKTSKGATTHDLGELREEAKKYHDRKYRWDSGTWHEFMLRYTASLAGRGFSDEQIQEECAPCCDLGKDDPDLEELIRSAQAKFGPKAIPAGVAAVAAAAAAAGGAPNGAAITWDRTARGVVSLSRPNAARAMEGLGLSFKHDTFHNRMWVESLHGIKALHVGELNDTRVRALRDVVHAIYRLDFQEKPIREAAVTLAEKHAFDPVADMLDEAQERWDGVERIDHMAVDYFNAEDTPLNRAFVRKLMIAAVRRVRKPGCKFDNMLVMESREGWNKSSAWRVLAGEGNFSDESIMGRETRYVQENLADIWILECAELAGITRREVDAITTFISRQDDRARPAYGHFLINQKRHSILVGTTNAEHWLPKQTGNRRFWPLRVLAPIDLRQLRRDRLQLWGEAARLEAAGEILTIDEALFEEAGIEQEARRIVDPWEDVLVRLKPIANATLGMVGLYDTAIVHQMDGFQFVVSADIFEHALKRVTLDGNSSRRLATVMRQLGWVHSRAWVDGVQQRGYRREPQQKKNKPRLVTRQDSTGDT